MKIKLIALLLMSTSATGAEIYAQDGTYLGKLGGSSSQYESTANPNGPYGSTWGVNSINNPNGRYGASWSTQSPNNPYTITPPVIKTEDDLE
jgi:hypothetical protein